jgi:competence ComEA-like helix-hairpin-helix protein
MKPRVAVVVMVVTLTLLGVTWFVSLRNNVDPHSLTVLPTNERIDLNAATAGELMLLPGIGPTTAQRIVEYRQKHGMFEYVDDLNGVERIGAVTVERLRPYVTVTP